MIGLAMVSAATLIVVAARLLVVRTLDGTFVVGWPSAVLGQFRIDAVLAAAAAGAALGVSGAIMQTLFRNPLASSFVLGVTSGAGAGVAPVAEARRPIRCGPRPADLAALAAVPNSLGMAAGVAPVVRSIREPGRPRCPA